jgi:protein-tyrosine kinase
MITLTQDSAATSTRRGGTGGAVAEQYYALAHWLRPAQDALAGERAPIQSKTIGITSCARGAGVSTVAANLAIAAARTGDQPVLLVDLSGHGSPLTVRTGLKHGDSSGDLGLAAALAGRAEPQDCVIASAIPQLSLLGGADLASSPLSVIDGGRIVDLLRDLERRFSFVVVDLPPTDSGLCFSTAGTLDGVLLVMDGQRTHSGAAVRAKQRLIHANAAVLGIILNHYSLDLPRWLDARL